MTDRSTETVAVIGAGIGGLYLVAALGTAGFKLRLHDIDNSRLSEIRARAAGWMSRASRIPAVQHQNLYEINPR